MREVKCLNCGQEFSLTKTYADDNGLYTICPSCGSSFDTDEEVELSDSQSKRCDEIFEAVYEMCKVITENDNLEWDMAYIGELADIAANLMSKRGEKVRFPGVITETDDSQYIAEYYDAEFGTTEYAVEVMDKNGKFVRQIDVFDTYEEAETFAKTYDRPLKDGEYLNIIPINYDENGDETAFASVV